jgi:DNA modification methylase
VTATILQGNALALPLDDNTVDLIVTSPPYFGLRSYQDAGEHYDGQLGSEATPAEFVDALIAATREMVRVVKPSGSIWVNLGDKYAEGQRRLSSHGQSATGLASQHAARAAQANRVNNPINESGIRAKSLIGVPWRYALACIDDLGLILRAEIIWSKPNGLPESVTDRVRRSHETWFHFTLNPRYYSAVDEIREEHAEAERNGRLTWEQRRAREDHAARYSDQNGHGGTAGMTQSPLGKLPGSVWTIPTQPLTVPPELGVDHFAAFPMEWPRRIVTGWSPREVCTVCGQGRRPVKTDTGQLYGQQYANHRRAAELIQEHGFDLAALRALGPSKWERWKAKGSMGVHGADAALCERVDRLLGGYAECAIVVAATKVMAFTGYACACPDTTAPATPGTVLDPFGGTGTTALVAHALGRHGISVDMSADYCRLARWRTTDPNQLATAMQVDKPAKQIPGQEDLFTILEEGIA